MLMKQNVNNDVTKDSPIAAGSLFQINGAAKTKEHAPSVASIFCCGYYRTVLLFERRL